MSVVLDEAALGRRVGAASAAAYASFGPVLAAGSARVLLVPEAPASPMLNRVVGLGDAGPASDGDVDVALAAVPTGTTFYVSVEPEAEPSGLPERLAARGLQPGWGWMRFVRDPTAPSAPGRTEPEIVRVDDGRRLTAFAEIVQGSFGLPDAARAAVERAAPDPRWELLLAVAGGEPAAAAGLFVHEGVGYLGMGATRADRRGQGAQTALLHHRLRRCAELGLELAVTETGELRDDLPSASYRNIVRAGFRETTVLANWLGRA